MKRQIIVIFIFCSIFLFNPNIVLAHPGRTDSSGCHKCNTNCEKWGLNTGEYHCHSGNNYTNSRGQMFNSAGNLISSNSSLNTNSSSSSNNQGTVSKSILKSSDNTLKNVTIDGENIKVSNEMIYETKKEKIEILVETNNDKATYDISNSSLTVGKNIIVIKVTAENGDVKDYNLVVNRAKLSNNTNIKIIVDDKEINFVLGKANVDVSSDTKDLNYKYELEDANSTVSIDGDKDLKFGENIVNFVVKAEDGSEKKYELTVTKFTKMEEVMGTILGLVAMVGIGYGIYYVVKKERKGLNNN